MPLTPSQIKALGGTSAQARGSGRLSADDLKKLGGSPSTRYTRYGPGRSGKKPEGGSVVGFAQNVAGDVRDIAVGIGPGLYQTGKAVGGDIEDLLTGEVKEPSDIGKRTKEIGKKVGESYAETYGSWDKFKRALYNDPLFIGLDIATVFSGGGAALSKGAKVSSRLDKVSKAGKTITLPGGVKKPLARNELRAQVQAAGAKIRPEIRAAKQERTRLVRQDANIRAQGLPLERALKKARKQPEKVAAALLGRFDRQALDEYTSFLSKRAEEDPRGPARTLHKVITDPRVQRLFDSPNPRVTKVLEESRALGEKQKVILGIDPMGAEARRFLPARVAGGARWDDELGDFVGGPSIEDLRARGLDPIYFPDTSKAPRLGYAPGRGGGVGVPQITGNMRQNKGSLMLAGQLILDPGVLSESFLRASKYAHYNDVHDSLLQMAKKVDYPEAGMVLIRKKRSDRISPKDRMRGDFEDWAATHLDAKDEYRQKDPGFTTNSFEEAVKTEDGKYLAVPENVVRTLAGEFTKQNQLIYWMNRKPMRVWRALVLGLRPAYLVNNAVGNTLLYLMHSGRPEDIRQLAGAFRQMVKPSEGKEIDRLLERHFAGQAHGGFIASQYPDLTATGKMKGAKDALAAVVGAIPALDKRWEQALRRAKVKAELKRHPGLRKHAERMGSENAFFEKVSPLLDENPEIVTQVYDRVNDALGNYDSMGQLERNAIRTLFPFYAWYKAITVVSAKLTLEQPLKIDLASRLGQIAIEENLEEAGLNRDEVPSSLLGFIPTKREGDRVRGFNTSSVNPFATVGQLADFAVSPTKGSGAPGRVIPGPNPFITDLVSFIFGQTPAGYGTPDVPGMGTVESIPQWRLAEAFERTFGVDIPGVEPAPDGNTFNDRDFWDELLRYAGVPYARVSPTAAKRVAGG